MNKLFIAFLAAISVSSAFSAETLSEQKVRPLADQKNLKMTKNFTGNVFYHNSWSATEPMRAGGGYVTCAPGARTYLHEHPGGQSFVVVSREGYVQEEGKPKLVVHMGDSVVCPPNVKHWHGASETKSMTHLAVTEKSPGKPTAIWHGPVSDEDYHNQSSSGRIQVFRPVVKQLTFAKFYRSLFNDAV